MFGLTKNDIDRLEDKINVIRQEMHEIHAWKAELDHIRRMCEQMYQILKKLEE